MVTGSHDLGFRASHNNDENMVIIRGHRGLAARASLGQGFIGFSAPPAPTANSIVHVTLPSSAVVGRQWTSPRCWRSR